MLNFNNRLGGGVVVINIKFTFISKTIFKLKYISCDIFNIKKIFDHIPLNAQ